MNLALNKIKGWCIKVLSFFKEPEFTFKTAGDRDRFNFNIESINPVPIAVYRNSKQVATFERWRRVPGQPTTLEVTHFATTGDSAGKGYGARILRAFAAGINEGAPDIEVMVFKLSSSPTRLNEKQKTDQELAEAREKLFNTVGMLNVQQIPQAQGKITTSGTWNKSSW